MEVCQPSATNGNGNPANNVSGASTGKVYHHLVIVPKEITVRGRINLIANCFIFSWACAVVALTGCQALKVL